MYSVQSKPDSCYSNDLIISPLLCAKAYGLLTKYKHTRAKNAYFFFFFLSFFDSRKRIFEK